MVQEAILTHFVTVKLHGTHRVSQLFVESDMCWLYPKNKKCVRVTLGTQQPKLQKKRRKMGEVLTLKIQLYTVAQA